MRPAGQRSSKTIENGSRDAGRHIMSKRLGRSLQEDENLKLDAIEKLLRFKRTGQKNSQARDRAEFAVERNVAAGRRLPRGQSNSI